MKKVDGYPVYSMATPTIAGAKEMLTYLNAKPTETGDLCQKVVLTDLREEAVVYINGTPFVLRELNQPVDTLKHVGITGPVVEHMESRLKEDILAEVTKSGGRMLLHREEYNPALNQISVIGYWENILADDVKTPAEVYAGLKDEHYNIEYRRIPLTREREALPTDVDAIQYCKDEAHCTQELTDLGICQNSESGLNLVRSFGGVSYAMAITCLRLNTVVHFASNVQESLDDTESPNLSSKDSVPSQASDEEACKEGDYRDILSLTRVLIYGPKSKAKVDKVIERCAGAGHLQGDVLHYRKEIERCLDVDDENKSYLVDMGIKALRPLVALTPPGSLCIKEDCAQAVLLSDHFSSLPLLHFRESDELHDLDGSKARTWPPVL
ncbi:hypothetical protein IFM89_013095 [Coptis chinensis]|uniref:Paladin n=1 Tax=Coptis chinensis TaxID=261450 RepID=A0A835IPJ9_9MAGN|nr:hypothetical protein IFM89_013095 [Coptis chinensis]